MGQYMFMHLQQKVWHAGQDNLYPVFLDLAGRARRKGATQGALGCPLPAHFPFIRLVIIVIPFVIFHLVFSVIVFVNILFFTFVVSGTVIIGQSRY